MSGIASMRHDFDEIDTDKDGFVTAAELAASLQTNPKVRTTTSRRSSRSPTRTATVASTSRSTPRSSGNPTGIRFLWPRAVPARTTGVTGCRGGPPSEGKVCALPSCSELGARSSELGARSPEPGAREPRRAVPASRPQKS